MTRLAHAIDARLLAVSISHFAARRLPYCKIADGRPVGTRGTVLYCYEILHVGRGCGRPKTRMGKSEEPATDFLGAVPAGRLRHSGLADAARDPRATRASPARRARRAIRASPVHRAGRSCRASRAAGRGQEPPSPSMRVLRNDCLSGECTARRVVAMKCWSPPIAGRRTTRRLSSTSGRSRAASR